MAGENSNTIYNFTSMRFGITFFFAIIPTTENFVFYIISDFLYILLFVGKLV